MLTKQEVADILASKGLTATDISQYKNLDTELELVCKNGHHIKDTLKHVRNPNFKCAACDGQSSVGDKINVAGPPIKTGKRVVGIDNASENAGVSVFDDGKLVFYHLYHYHGETIDRLAANRKFIEESIIDTWNPDLVVVEDIQYQNGNIVTYKTLAMLLGNTLVSLRNAGIKTETVYSKVWRSNFLINGKTRIEQKRQAIDKVREMYNIVVSDDVAEAILIGKYGIDCLKKVATKKLF